MVVDVVDPEAVEAEAGARRVLADDPGGHAGALEVDDHALGQIGREGVAAAVDGDRHRVVAQRAAVHRARRRGELRVLAFGVVARVAHAVHANRGVRRRAVAAEEHLRVGQVIGRGRRDREVHRVRAGAGVRDRDGRHRRNGVREVDRRSGRGGRSGDGQRGGDGQGRQKARETRGEMHRSGSSTDAKQTMSAAVTCSTPATFARPPRLMDEQTGTTASFPLPADCRAQSVPASSLDKSSSGSTIHRYAADL